MKVIVKVNTKIILMITVAAAAILLVVNCTGNSINKLEELTSLNSGSVIIDINVGKVGVLAKKVEIEMKMLYINIYEQETETVIIEDSVNLSGCSEDTVQRIYTDLSSPNDFTLKVYSLDTNGKIIHSGSYDFETIQKDTVDISLNLEAQYSMLRVSFDNFADYMNKVILRIDSNDIIDSSFIDTLKTVVLSYDYLTATTEGEVHDISIQASGNYYGTDTILYSTDTSIIAKSGINADVKLPMIITSVLMKNVIPRGDLITVYGEYFNPDTMEAYLCNDKNEYNLNRTIYIV